MKKIKILFIEDEKLLRTLFEDSIAGYGDQYPGYSFESDATPDLNSAMNYLKENPAMDIIVLDLRLPVGETGMVEEVPEKENGFTILKYVRSDMKFKDTKVMVFTNLSDPETKGEAETLGADGFMVKSKTLPTELLEKIISLLK
jgi:CheY-like chemotaxis protein